MCVCVGGGQDGEGELSYNYIFQLGKNKLDGDEILRENID